MKKLIKIMIVLSLTILAIEMHAQQYDDVYYNGSVQVVDQNILPPFGYKYYADIGGKLYPIEYSQLSTYNTFEETVCTDASTGIQTKCYIASNVTNQTQHRKAVQPIGQSSYPQQVKRNTGQNGNTTIIKKNINNYGSGVANFNNRNLGPGNFLGNNPYPGQYQMYYLPGKGFINHLQKEYYYNLGYQPYKRFHQIHGWIWELILNNKRSRYF